MGLLTRKDFLRLSGIGIGAAGLAMLTGCSSSSSSTSEATESTDTVEETTQEETAEETAEEEGTEYPAYVEEPITIEFWHTRGSGANGTVMTAAIEKFNEENEYGITVVGTYVGSYTDCLAKTTTAIAAGNNPVIILNGAGAIENLAGLGVLADLSSYIERDGFDLDNIPQNLLNYLYWGDEMVSLPYIVSSAVFYYNKDLWGETAPSNLDELVSMAEQVYAEHPDIKAFQMTNEMTYIERPLLESMGGEGWVNSEGTAPASLDDGHAEAFLSDWLSWVEAGWCGVPAATSAGTQMIQDFYNGQLASFYYSSGSLANAISTCKEMGIDLGFSYMVGYDGPTAPIGGGSVMIVGRNHSQQEIAAAWEFIKFLYEDEQIATDASSTGYLPMTYTSAETETIQNLWEENEGAKIAYEQLEWATWNPKSVYKSEWDSVLSSVGSYVIQDQSMTPAEAVEYLREQGKVVFGTD